MNPPPKRPAAAAPASRRHQRTGKAGSALAALLIVLALAGCGNKPRQPDWLVNADGAQDRFERAYLSGNDRVASAEFARFRHEVASTAQPALVARVELTRCAVRLASLDLAPCAGFERLRPDASDAERAYADFLAGVPLGPEQVKLLPEEYRAVAGGPGGAAPLKGMKSPLSRMIAAAVLLRSEKADPEVLQIATDTASEQGWRRAVLAWLGAQAMRAEKAGAVEEARRLRRRMELAGE
jgi:hypothetical protein